MLTPDLIKDILIKNNNLRKLKDDPTVKSTCIRVINLFIDYGLYCLDERGNVFGFKSRKIDTLTNFELLHVIESIIASNDKTLMDHYLVQIIMSIDYIGQCWFYPKELSVIIFNTTAKRHNYKKIKILLNQLVDENVCLKLTNKKRQSMYRILYTYEVSDD